MTAALPKDISQAAHAAGQYILSCQQKDGCIPWFKNTAADPWNHIEAAMGLAITGHIENSINAYEWLRSVQNTDGSWQAIYQDEQHADRHKVDTNFVAYIATGIWHLYLVTQNKEILIDYYPCVEKALNYVLSQQNKEGDIQWAISSHEKLPSDALVTASSSIYKSLECAISIAQVAGTNSSKWQTARQQLGDALANKPERFDRTWESKARYSMDWFYPIFTNAANDANALQRVTDMQSIFVEKDLGCRCVSDEPWITIAETCEYIIALSALDKKAEAKRMLHLMLRWQDSDGGFWTGYNFKNKNVWPEEKTTWTAGAFLLAVDSVYHLTSASTIFSRT